MNVDAILNLLPFAIVAGITPGPNNIIVMSCAIHRGLRATFPYQTGAGISCVIIIFLFIILGNSLAEILPAAILIIKYPGCLYMLWLAWVIFYYKAETGANQEKAATFLSGFVVQFVNPKYYMYVATLAGALSNPHSTFLDIPGYSLVFSLIAVAGMSLWGIGGSLMQNIFSKYQKPINIILALALCWSAWDILEI